MTIPPEMIEAVARAIWNNNFHPADVDSGEAERRVTDWPSDWAKAGRQARAAIRTLAPMMAEMMAEVAMLEPAFKHGPALTREAYRRDIAAAIRELGKEMADG